MTFEEKYVFAGNWENVDFSDDFLKIQIIFFDDFFCLKLYLI